MPAPSALPSHPRAALLALALAACATPKALPPRAPAAAVAPLRVDADSFARDCGALLAAGPDSPDRPARLAGVVRFQLGRAAKLFETGHAEAGREAVHGAVLLALPGELGGPALAGLARPLVHAANAVAREGREGRALALYELSRDALPGGPERARVEAHIAAILGFTEATRSRARVQGAGDDQRVAVDRALWDLSPGSARAARAATLRWIEEALEFSREQMPPTDDAAREEAIEAYRAIRTGAMTLAALSLRSGDAAGALEALEHAAVSRIVSPHLHEALRRAAEDDDADAWTELYAQFDRASSRGGEGALDPDLAQAAAFGAAARLHRLSPGSLRGTMPIAGLLLQHGMSEVGALIVAPLVAAADRPDVASFAVGYALEAIAGHDRTGDVEAARRTFAHAEPTLAEIEQRPWVSAVSPSPSRLRFAMAALEVRAARLDAARPLVEAAAAREPSVAALGLLGMIDRHRGDADRALGWFEKIAAAATASGDPAGVAEAHLSRAEVLEDRDDQAGVARELGLALARALDARVVARSAQERAAAERTLARVLEHYGDLDGAHRATLRALAAAPNDRRASAATALDAARRGLARGDLRTARAAARAAIERTLPGADAAYVAVWLRMLERRLRVPTDGTVEEALALVDEDAGWPARLEAWCAGRIGDEQLAAAARGPAEATEAAFYAAMAAWAAHDGRAPERLATIARSPSVELVEISLARELARAAPRAAIPLPAGLALP